MFGWLCLHWFELLVGTWFVAFPLFVWHHNPMRKLARHYSTEPRFGCPTVHRCWIEIQNSPPSQPWRPSMGRWNHYPNVDISVCPEELQFELKYLLSQRYLLIPWSDVTVFARRGPYEYYGSVLLRFAKEPNIGMHLSGAAMDELLRIGLPFRIGDDGYVVRCETASETKASPP